MFQAACLAVLWNQNADLILRHAGVLRDIFGNPFRPVAFDPRWRTSDVLGLAQAIYDDRAFERIADPGRCPDGCRLRE